MNSLLIFSAGLLIVAFVVLMSFIVILKLVKLTIKHNRLSKYLYNYLNTIISARYGNLKSRCEDGIDALTIQLSRNTNALLESIFDRDVMINEYIEREKESQNLKQDFISSLAHDLKVPIIAQDNTYDLFLSGNFGELTDVQKNAVQNLKISNSDLKNLVIDLLDAHKFEGSELVLSIQPVDITALIDEVIIQNQSILKIRNKVLNFNSNVDNCTYPLDSFMMKRVLNNLISNAVFYGKNSKDIDIELNRTDKDIQISITDYGEGIKEDEIKNIFAKYYTSAKKYANIGAGLGLYIANKIILKHGGKIIADNVKGKGARFTIKLPL